MNDEYFFLADSLADNSSALNLSDAICQDLRRYSSKFTEEQEAEIC
ncbi:MAG: hypothetical protein J1F17_02220 [Oscillospiraceae bacterium]|nr:hypothetical protein [Oscillospiraceae bacterium]